jgi:hypothetical protein
VYRKLWGMDSSPHLHGLIADCIKQEKADTVYRKWFFVILCMVEVLLNLDSGLVPACLAGLMHDLNMSEEDAGLGRIFLFLWI